MPDLNKILLLDFQNTITKILPDFEDAIDDIEGEFTFKLQTNNSLSSVDIMFLENRYEHNIIKYKKDKEDKINPAIPMKFDQLYWDLVQFRTAHSFLAKACITATDIISNTPDVFSFYTSYPDIITQYPDPVVEELTDKCCTSKVSNNNRNTLRQYKLFNLFNFLRDRDIETYR